MNLINTSFHLELSFEQEFLGHAAGLIRAISAADGFSDPLLTRLLIEVEPGTISYSIQFRSASLPLYDQWMEHTGAELIDSMLRLACGRLVCFTTPMEIVT